MNTNRIRSRSGPAQAAVFFLAVWLVAAVISAVPVFLMARGMQSIAAATPVGNDRNATGPTEQVSAEPVGEPQGGSGGAGEQPDPGQAANPGRAPAPRTTSAPAPEAEPAPESDPAPPSTTSAPAEPEYTPVTMTVQHTRGANGNGDGFVSVRTGPDGDYTRVRKEYEGSTVTGSCWVSGETVTPTVTEVPVSKWVRLSDGNYATGAYLTNLDQLPAC